MSRPSTPTATQSCATQASVASKTDAGKAPKIEVSAVTKTFTVDGKTLTAVDDVSFIVPAGTTHALVGEVGLGQDDDDPAAAWARGT